MSFPSLGGGAAIIGNNISSFSIERGHGRLKHTCPNDSICDAYVVGFDGESSQVSGTFAGVKLITDTLDGAGGLTTLANLGFGLVFEGSEDVLTSKAHPTGDAFFLKCYCSPAGFSKIHQNGRDRHLQTARKSWKRRVIHSQQSTLYQYHFSPPFPLPLYFSTSCPGRARTY